MKIQTLSIIAGNAGCNARCPYCISRMTGNKVSNAKINWRNFAKACRLSQVNDVTTVLITGKGEPTLFPDQITEYLKHMEPYNFPIIELQTNGINFQQNPDKYNKYLEEWYSLGLTVVSISIVSFDAEVNRGIYVPYLKEYMNLGKLIERLHNMGFSVRLSCTLIKSGLDKIAKVKKLIKMAKLWKVEQLTLRKLAIPDKAVENVVKVWSLKHRLSQKYYDSIANLLVKEGVRISTYDYGGEVFDVDGQNVCFTNALTLSPDSEAFRQVIFFPDGHLRFDWQYQGAIIY